MRGGSRRDREVMIAGLDWPGRMVAAGGCTPPVARAVHRRRQHRAGPRIVGAGGRPRPRSSSRHRTVDRRPGTAADRSREQGNPDLAGHTKERTRFYSRLRTLRIAHGLVEFLRDLPVQAPASLVVENLDEADPTDAEFMSILLLDALTRADCRSRHVHLVASFRRSWLLRWRSTRADRRSAGGHGSR